LYFFTINACSETGAGCWLGGSVVLVGDGLIGPAADGEEDVALGLGAGGAASSLVQATAAVVTNATTPAHAIRRPMRSSLRSDTKKPVDTSCDD
jgi:hypothetical protein